jgi:RimJ/RimL family protein N-acetyltransferase
VKGSDKVIAIHGCVGQDPIVYIGGRDALLREQIQIGLAAAGFEVRQSLSRNLQGDHPHNICNRGSRKCGVQLEISEGLRQQMFRRLASRKGRLITHEVFEQFVSAVRKAILPGELDAAELQTSTNIQPRGLEISWLRRWGDDQPLETEHLILRAFEDSDLKDLERILSNRAAARSFPLGLPHTKKKIALLHARWKARVWNHCALFLKKQDHLIGFTGVRKLRGNYQTEFFYHIESEFWSEDLAVEAARGWLTKYFEFGGGSLPQLAAVANPTDLPARRVLTKLGMHFVGTTQSHGVTMLYYEISRKQLQSAK